MGLMHGLRCGLIHGEIKTWVETWTWIETWKIECMEGWLETWVEILAHGSRHGFEISSRGRKKSAGLLAWVYDPTFACDKLGFDEGVRVRS
jgi:hypothetical protein